MDAQTKSMTTRYGKNMPGYDCDEVILFAEDVAILGQLLFRHARQHFIYDEIDVHLPAGFVFGRKVMRAEKRGNVIQRRLLIELPDRAKNLQFVFEREAVT